MDGSAEPAIAEPPARNQTGAKRTIGRVFDQSTTKYSYIQGLPNVCNHSPQLKKKVKLCVFACLFARLTA